ncbi:MAG: methionine--tRNA ligase [Rickettsiaceae bacterium]|nr:methionine--tRNA ligase [Rickettsiaceae bacterium]
MKNKYYITTPIYYPNDKPHLGHAYTNICCDILARFARLKEYDVYFLTGTDEHGQKLQKAAENADMQPSEFVDSKVISFLELNSLLNISNDDFIRTTQIRHTSSVQYLWNLLLEKGHIYKGKYDGWYSVRDESFYSENELRPDGKAPTGAEVEWVEEESFFFRLSHFQDKLLEFYESNHDFIQPTSRRNEVINFVKSGLKDLSISRTSFTWGIKVPNEQNHVIYVWLDALTNYISALGYPNEGGKMKEFWPANVHMIGKDILRFHAIFWPAFLMAADIKLPKHIAIHGWWMNEGEKMSKSIGNVIDPVSIVQKYNADALRYFVAKEMPFGQDGNFVEKNLQNRYNTELANKIGNLLQRTLALVRKNFDSKIPNVKSIEDLYKDSELLQIAAVSYEEIDNFLQKYEFHNALEQIIKIADRANEYIDQIAPWHLIKTDLEKTAEVLYILVETCRYIATLLQAFIPDSADKMLHQLNIHIDMRKFKCLNSDFALKPGTAINSIQPIFVKF